MRIDQGVDKFPTSRFSDAKLELPIFSAKLMASRFERMSVVSFAVEVFRAIAPRDHHGKAVELLTQMAQQGDRPGISPVQIFEDEEQRPATGEALEELGALLEQEALLHARCDLLCGFLCRELLQLLSIRRAAAILLCVLEQAARADEGFYEVGTDFEKRRESVRQEMPEAKRLAAAHRSCFTSRFHIARQKMRDLAEGEVGVARPGLSIAVADRGHELVVLLLGAPDELVEKRSLTAPRLAGHENELSRACERLLESFREPSICGVTADEKRRGAALSFIARGIEKFWELRLL